MNHADRRAAAWAAARAAVTHAQALLVTSLPNIRYLTGFSGSNACLLLGDDLAILGTDGRYVVQAAEECPGLELLIDRDTAAATVAHAVGQRRCPIAFEADHLSVSAHRRLVDVLGDERQLQPTSGVVETQRIVKDPDEVALIARACEISDAALAATLARMRVGMSERDVARALESAMWDHGADGIAFETIVGAGPHSAIPHHQPTDRPLESGDLVVIDFGAMVSGYHSDQTRTVVVGPPADWQREIHGLVAAAQQAGRESATAGRALLDMDRAARGPIEDAGQGEHFGHGLGHGVGLEIHEAPMIGPRAAVGILSAGSTVTVEPGVYLPGRGGVRIEDTVLVTDDGPCAPLTATDRGLLVVG